MTEHQVAIDLGKLAVTRTREAITSVAQLLDPTGPHVYAILVVVALDLIDEAARTLQAGMEKQNGKRPSDEAAKQHVVAEILETLGYGAQFVKAKPR